MITTLTIAALTALSLVLLALAWREHDRADRLRIRAEEADSWAQWFEESAKEVAAQLRAVRAERDAIQRSHDNVHELYCALVRRRLQETSYLVGRNLHRN